MLLDQLPTEVLYLIFTSFERDRSTLYHLSLTNRIISQIARPLIPSYIHIHPLHSEEDNHDLPSHASIYPRCVSSGVNPWLLRRTIEENPGFGHGVNFLTICFRTIRTYRPPRLLGQEKEEFAVLLKAFPKVRYLDMNSGRPNQASLLLDEDLGMRDSLEEINISARGITPWQLANIASLPNLRHLSVFGSLFGRWTENPDHSAQHNDLQSLSMVFGIKLPALREILRCSNRLKKLDVCAPLDAVRQPDRMVHGSVPQEYRKRLDPFFAAAVGDVLAIIKETLVHLYLNSTNATWPGSDGTRLDLSGFQTLKFLSLTAWCFFEPLTTGKARDGVFKLLPLSLEELYLNFQTEIGIFYEVIDDKLEEEGRRNFTNNSIKEHKIRWISQLAEEKKEHFPHLRVVELREELESKTKHLFQLGKWELPDNFKSGFEDEGIELSVHVRVPKVSTAEDLLRPTHRTLARAQFGDH